MKIGIVGLPNVGKSTLFNALCKAYTADAANFPFCTIEPNVGIVDVTDDRVDRLAEISSSKKKVYAHTEFVDIAGLVKGASKGEGLGNRFLSHIREVDAIVQVLRHFNDSDIVHVEGDIDPIRDVEIINTELIFSDLEQIDRKLPHLQKQLRVGDKKLKKEVEILERIQSLLQEGKMANVILDELNDEDRKYIKQYNLLTIKPFIYALNISQEDIENKEELEKEFGDRLGSKISVVCAKVEEEIMDMERLEKQEFLAELLEIEHVHKIPTLDDLISLAFNTLGLMYYFTTGEKETKARTIAVGSTAPQAAGAIHGDFERGFIKAEVVSYNDLVSHGSRSKAREKGLLKIEGKDYIVKDGDVIVFRFNV